MSTGGCHGLPCRMRVSAFVGERVSARGRHANTRRGVGAPRRAAALWLCWLVFLGGLLSLQAARAQTPPGTTLSNEATVAYRGASGAAELTVSNRVDILTVPQPTPSTLSLTRVVTGNPELSEPVGPAYCGDGAGGFALLADPTLLGNAPVDPTQPQDLANANRFHGGEPVFVRVTDADKNLDASQPDTLEVLAESSATGDSELLRLTETGPDTGVFAGFIPTATATAQLNNCVLEVAADADLRMTYTDPLDATDVSQDQALVDPISLVFDATSGLPVDGALVTLIDTDTGQAASVLGDDGVSMFPASLTSGGTATDSGGTLYTFSNGSFRFPVVAAGNYRLVVQPPMGYQAPSTRGATELQTLPGAPYALNAGSFGQPFSLALGPNLEVDIPLDPTSAALFVQKSSQVSQAAPGDFVEYLVSVTNADPANPTGALEVHDQPPAGLRYVPGSARLDADTLSDPAIGDAGRSLTFAIGNMVPGEQRQLRYVLEVTPAVSRGPVHNLARAVSAAGVVSNEARAGIEIADDLFRSESLLVGRVIVGSCAGAVADDLEGLAGVRIYLEDGRYGLTDEGGRFHFEGLTPGAHVLQLDLDTLPEGFQITPCEDNARFAGRAFSQFVELTPGSLWRADFHVQEIEPASGHVDVQLAHELVDDELHYTVNVAGSGVPVSAVSAMIMLPDGVAYLAGSAGGGRGDAEPRVAGAVLSFDLGDRRGEWREQLTFAARVAPGAAGNLVSRAVARFKFDAKAVQTPTAETRAFRRAGTSVVERYVLSLRFETLSATLAPSDRAQLDGVVGDWQGMADVHLRATGHSDAVPIALANRDRFTDNYALSRARAAAVAHYLQERLSLPPSRISYRGLGADQPVADNTTASGRAENRRVELHMTGLRPDKDPELKLLTAASGVQRKDVVPAQGRQITRSLLEEPAETSTAVTMAAMPDFPVDELDAGTAWLWPEAGFSPAIPSLKVAIQHPADARVELTLNDMPVSGLNFEGAAVSADGTVALSRWRGLDLADGPNRLTARISRDDQLLQTLERAVHFAGAPIRGELVVERSQLVADGRNSPVLAVRFVDRWGKPARRGTVGNFRVDPPYRSQWEVQALRENQLLVTGARTPTYRLGEGGIALIELEPTNQTGEVAVHLEYPDDVQQELRGWLAPAARDWILVGLAEGTIGYNTINDNMELAAGGGHQDHYYDDAELAFFAKGRIKGEFLLTLAYDSRREHAAAADSLFGVIDPERFYTLYGDTSEQHFDAPSQRRLYVKLERNAFVALFGDYETGLTVTELGRYARSLNGFKSEFQSRRLSYNAFASSTDQAFIKDELLADGTSGPYQLSRSDIVLNSDKLTVEVRDRFRPEQIISERGLQRHVDYQIDYLTGTVFLKAPLAGRDDAFNPVYVVVDYESRDGRDQGTVAGGRAAVHFLDDRADFGLTAIREGLAGGDGSLAGVDLKLRVGSATEVRAEWASSKVDNITSGRRSGAAYLAEVEHRTGRLDARAYVREQASEFGLGQQRGTEAGTRRSGLDLHVERGDNWRVNGEAFRQENLDTGAVRDVLEAEGRYQDPRRSGALGLRQVVDADGAGQTLESSQAYGSASWRFLDELLTARLTLETALGGRDSSIDYPSRSLLGLDAAVSEAVTLFGEYELAEGSAIQTQMTRVGVKATPGQGTQVSSSLSQQTTEYGPRSFASLGLTQGWQLGERWALDVGVDHSNTLRAPGVAPLNATVPLASGSLAGDYTAAYFGALYRSENWTFTSRVERRDSDSEDRTALLAGFYRERNSGRGFSARLDVIDSNLTSGAVTLDAGLRLGWAHRPADSRFIVLDRLDLVGQTRKDGISDSRTSRVVNNLNANWLPNRRNQVALQFGAKYVRSNFAGFSATGYLDLWGMEWRRQLTQRFDAGFNTSIYRSVRADVHESGLGLDLGINVATNLYVSIGYNFSGFYDEDFSRNRYTAQGPFLSFRLKADQATLKALLER